MVGNSAPGILSESWSSKVKHDMDMKDENDTEANQVALYLNSGVKITRQDEVRFTVGSHGWENTIDETIYHTGEMVGTWERQVWVSWKYIMSFPTSSLTLAKHQRNFFAPLG